MGGSEVFRATELGMGVVTVSWTDVSVGGSELGFCNKSAAWGVVALVVLTDSSVGGSEVDMVTEL